MLEARNQIEGQIICPHNIKLFPVAILARDSDDPSAMDKVKLFFEMFSQLLSWFTNLWILVVASNLWYKKGTQFLETEEKMKSFVGYIANKIVKAIPRSKKVAPTIKSVKPTKDIKGSVKRVYRQEESKRIDKTVASKEKMENW